MIEMAAIHDSSTCDADHGRCCDMCAHADREERKARRCGAFKPSVLGVPEPQDQCTLPEGHEGKHTLSVLARKVAKAGLEGKNVSEGATSSLWADVATIRAALADILDAYPPASVGCEPFWKFVPQDESEVETETRAAFIDAVLQRITQLQSPPHDYPRLDSSSSSTAAQIDDLGEMRRLVKGRLK